MNYPLSDGDMIYDFNSHRYILTPDYIVNKLGIDIQARVGSNRAIASANLINILLNNISIQVYGFIFAHNNRKTLEYLVAKSPSARQIIMDAMGQQAVYILSVGDPTRMLDETKRRMWLDVMAENILKNQEVDETGVPLAYVGKTAYLFFERTLPDYTKGNY